MALASVLWAVRCKPQAISAMNLHQPFMLHTGIPDWTRDVVEGQGAMGLIRTKELAESMPRKIRILVLYGSLRERCVSVVNDRFHRVEFSKFTLCLPCRADHILG